jgi:hypothetical protein
LQQIFEKTAGLFRHCFYKPSFVFILFYFSINFKPNFAQQDCVCFAAKADRGSVLPGMQPDTPGKTGGLNCEPLKAAGSGTA